MIRKALGDFFFFFRSGHSPNPGKEGEESEPCPTPFPVNFCRSQFGCRSSKGQESQRSLSFPHGVGDQIRVWRAALGGRDSGEVPAAVRPAGSGHPLLGLHHLGPGGQRQAGQSLRCSAGLCRVGRWVKTLPGCRRASGPPRTRPGSGCSRSRAPEGKDPSLRLGGSGMLATR